MVVYSSKRPDLTVTQPPGRTQDARSLLELEHINRPPYIVLDTPLPFDDAYPTPDIRLIVDHPLTTMCYRLYLYLVDIEWDKAVKVIDISKKSAIDKQALGSKLPILYFQGYLMGSVEHFLKMYASYRYKGTGLKRLVDYYYHWVDTNYNHEIGCKYSFNIFWPAELHVDQHEGENDSKSIPALTSDLGSDIDNMLVGYPKFQTSSGKVVSLYTIAETLCEARLRKFKPGRKCDHIRIPERRRDFKNFTGHELIRWMTDYQAKDPLTEPQASVAAQCLLDYGVVVPADKKVKTLSTKKRYLGMAIAKVVEDNYCYVFELNREYLISVDLNDPILNTATISPAASPGRYLDASVILNSLCQRALQVYRATYINRESNTNDHHVMNLFQLDFESSFVQQLDQSALWSKHECPVHHPDLFIIDEDKINQALAKKEAKGRYHTLWLLSPVVRVNSTGHSNVHNRGRLRKDVLASSPSLKLMSSSSSLCLCGICSEEDRLLMEVCSWINLHNICAIHGLLRRGKPMSEHEYRSFYKSTSYIIGGCRITLLDIQLRVYKRYKMYINRNRNNSSSKGSRWHENSPGNKSMKAGTLLDSKSSFTDDNASVNTVKRGFSRDGDIFSICAKSSMSTFVSSNNENEDVPSIHTKKRSPARGARSALGGALKSFRNIRFGELANIHLGRGDVGPRADSSHDSPLWLAFINVSQLGYDRELDIPIWNITTFKEGLKDRAAEFCSNNDNIVIDIDTAACIKLKIPTGHANSGPSIGHSDKGSGEKDKNIRKGTKPCVYIHIPGYLYYTIELSGWRESDVVRILSAHCTGAKKTILEALTSSTGRRNVTIKLRHNTIFDTLVKDTI